MADRDQDGVDSASAASPAPGSAPGSTGGGPGAGGGSYGQEDYGRAAQRSKARTDQHGGGPGSAEGAEPPAETTDVGEGRPGGGGAGTSGER